MPVAIVTGSDSGIGRATAVRLAVDGFDVGVTWHEDEKGAGEAAEAATAVAWRFGGSIWRISRPQRM